MARAGHSPLWNWRCNLAPQPFAPNAFDMVILGCANIIADEMNPARMAALRLGMVCAWPCR